MKGKAKVDYLNSQGHIGHDEAPDWGFLYETSTIKSPKWNVGDRVVLPDGREFRYAKSAGALKAEMGCEFTGTGYTAYTAFTTAAAIGAKEVTVPAATHAALAADALRGGYIVIFLSGAVQFRGIVGNDAAAENAAFKVYLDAPLTTAVTTSSACETYQNPYASVQTGSNVALAKAGLPVVAVSAASMYCWIQTKGVCFINPQALVGVDGDNTACWRHDGSLQDFDTAVGATTAAFCTSQIAGHKIMGDATANGPLFMLT